MPVHTIDIDAQKIQVHGRSSTGKDSIERRFTFLLDQRVQSGNLIVITIRPFEFGKFNFICFDEQTTPMMVIQQIPGTAVELSVPSAEFDTVAIGRANDLKDLFNDAVFASLRSHILAELLKEYRFWIDSGFSPAL
jgi:hypothetical protein